MATPNWDALHLRLAAGARDGLQVSGAAVTASTAGVDLTVADRDAYLNQAYGKYVLLAHASYLNDPSLKLLLQSFIKTVTRTATAGIISLSAITDFGIFISLISQTSGLAIERKSQEDFSRILRGVSDEVVATAISKFCYPSDTQIQIAPANDADTYDLVYMFLPATITEGGSTDITLNGIHNNVIVDFALWYYYTDKQEQQIADSHLKAAFAAVPFPVKVGIG